jgi:nucleoside-diphosphate-sugar epimerase
MRFLISGTATGLGASLHRRFGGEAYSRTSVLAPSGAFDTIIHCAVNTAKDVSHGTIDGYFRDNVELTRRLLAIRHDRFVFVSTIDVYPKTMAHCDEDAAINAHDISGVYAISKYYSEALVRAGARRPLILRAGALLGPSMRENSLTRMLAQPGASVGLSGASSFNYILHDDIGDLIEAAGRGSVTGILNACSANAVTLQEISGHFGCGTTFGGYTYATPAVTNRKAAALVRGLQRSSLETIGIHLARNCEKSSQVARD